MLWFYAPSMELFAGACLPAGSRATVSTFLPKQASLLGSRQTLLFQPVSTPQQFWDMLRDLFGLQNASCQALATHVHPTIAELPF